MAVEKTLKRLCRLREMEEEQSRLQLERLVTDRNRLQAELEAAAGRKRLLRRDFIAALHIGDTPGRCAAAMEMQQTGKKVMTLIPLLQTADKELYRGRDEYLSKRTRRQQVETLLVNARRAADIEVSRRAQQILDDWYGRKTQMARPTAQTHSPWQPPAAVDEVSHIDDDRD